MSYRDDEDSLSESQRASLILDISNKHTPDSVRQDAYRKLERAGISHREAQKEADRKHGDFWG